MTLLPILAASLCLVAQAPPPPAAAAPSLPGNLRWVVGVVTTASPGSLTVRLRDEKKTLTIATDTPTLPGVGAVVEIHYRDHDDIRTAAVVFESAAGETAVLSKRPGRSYRGVARQIRRGTLTMLVELRSRGVRIDRKTRLLDISGAELATGSKGVAGLVSAGDELLVKYDGDTDILPIGDMMLYTTSTTAIEIRRLRNVATEPMRATRSAQPRP